MPQRHALRKQTAQLEAGTGGRPIQPARRERRQRRGQRAGFIRRGAVLVGLQQIDRDCGLVKLLEDKAAHLGNRLRPVLFAQGVVVEAGQCMPPRRCPSDQKMRAVGRGAPPSRHLKSAVARAR